MQTWSRKQTPYICGLRGVIVTEWEGMPIKTALWRMVARSSEIWGFALKAMKLLWDETMKQLFGSKGHGVMVG